MSDHKTQLALLRDERVAALRCQFGVPERMALRFACAARDVEFTVVLSRLSPAAQFSCETIEMDTTASGQKESVKRRDAMTVAAHEVSFAAVRCACGRTGNWTLCARCGAFVCEAQTRGNAFRCRESCGAKGRTGPLTQVSAARSAASGPAIGRSLFKSLPKRR